jgi:hypothetical protein
MKEEVKAVRLSLTYPSNLSRRSFSEDGTSV